MWHYGVVVQTGDSLHGQVGAVVRLEGNLVAPLFSLNLPNFPVSRHPRDHIGTGLLLLFSLGHKLDLSSQGGRTGEVLAVNGMVSWEGHPDSVVHVQG